MFNINNCNNISLSRCALTRLSGPLGQGYMLVGCISVACVRPRTSKGIIDLLLSLSSSTQIKIKPNDFTFLGKSLYIQFTSQLFSTVYIPNRIRYTITPNSHKCKPSTDEIKSQKTKREEFFHLVDGLEVT